MTVFTHANCAHALEGKAGKKARRQCRDMMRAHFDYDAVRATAIVPVDVEEAYEYKRICETLDSH